MLFLSDFEQSVWEWEGGGPITPEAAKSVEQIFAL